MTTLLTPREHLALMNRVAASIPAKQRQAMRPDWDRLEQSYCWSLHALTALARRLLSEPDAANWRANLAEDPETLKVLEAAKVLDDQLLAEHRAAVGGATGETK